MWRTPTPDSRRQDDQDGLIVASVLASCVLVGAVIGGLAGAAVTWRILR